MNYFILGNDGQIFGPHSLNELNGLASSGNIGPATQICEEGSTAWKPLASVLQAGPVARPPAPVAMPQPQPAHAAPRQGRKPDLYPEELHLADIRARSCYKSLRVLLNVLAGLAILGSIAFVVYLLASETLGADLPSSEKNRIRVFVGISMVIELALIVATRQLMFVLIDIADTLLFEHSKNRNA